MVFISSNTLTLNNYNADISIRSQTVAPWSPSYINIDRKGFTFDWDKDGLHLFKIDKTTGTIIDRRRFVINNVLVSDTIINFLNTFDSTKYLLVCKVFASSGGTTLSVNARNKFKEFGSSYVDSVGSFGWYNTWSMIGYKGFNTLLNKESFVYYAGGSGDPSMHYYKVIIIFSTPPAPSHKLSVPLKPGRILTGSRKCFRIRVRSSMCMV